MIELISEKGIDQVSIAGQTWELPSCPNFVQHIQYRKLLDGRMAIGYLEDEPDPQDPFEEGWYRIYSFNRRHSNFKMLDQIEAEGRVKRKTIHLMLPLAWYGHSNELWVLRGELPPECQCPFDSHNFAGVWVPSGDCCEQIQRNVLLDLIAERPTGQAYLDRSVTSGRPLHRRSLTGLRNWLTANGGIDDTAIKALEIEAAKRMVREACKVWTAYANGEVYQTRLVILDAAGELVLDEFGSTYYGTDDGDREIKEWLEGLQDGEPE